MNSMGDFQSNEFKKINDIEDILSLASEHGFCPYFHSRENQSKSEIIFMPYNYLIDPQLRKRVHVDIADAIIILDEAHNLEKVCTDAASFEFNSIHLGQAIAEVEKVIRYVDNRMLDGPYANSEDKHKIMNQIHKDQDFGDMKKNFHDLKERLLDLDEVLDSIELPKEKDKMGITNNGDFVLELLSEMRLNATTYPQVSKTIELAISIFEDKQANNRSSAYGLQAVYDMASHIFGEEQSTESFNTSYKVYMEEKPNKIRISQENKDIYLDALQIRNRKKDFTYSKNISFWCFNPGISIQKIIKAKKPPQCFIFTSGTLSPMDSYSFEFSLNFPIRLENPHIISREQISVNICKSGPTGVDFDSRNSNRLNADYIFEIGAMLVNLSRIVPDGLLVFFPSHSLLNSCVHSWKQLRPNSTSSVWNSILVHKKIILEPSDGAHLSKTIKEYEEVIRDHTLHSPTCNGAVLLAVCRGRISEGLDFVNQNGRAVVIVGLPYPPVFDPKIKLKQAYLDDKSRKGPSGVPKLTGRQYYTQECSRAVNQAIGRVIRHRGDYGAVILCDVRFSNPNQKDHLSRWLRQHICLRSSFGETVQALTRFFRNAAKQYPVLETPKPDTSTEYNGPQTNQNTHFQYHTTTKNATSSPSDRKISISALKTSTDLLLKRLVQPSEQLQDGRNIEKNKQSSIGPITKDKHSIRIPKSTRSISKSQDSQEDSNSQRLSLSMDSIPPAQLLHSKADRPDVVTTPPCKTESEELPPLSLSIELNGNGNKLHNHSRPLFREDPPSAYISNMQKGKQTQSLDQCPSIHGDKQNSDPNRKESAAQYLKKVKESLKPEQYQQFKALLGSISKPEKKTSISAVCNGIIQLFMQDRSIAFSLLSGFVPFLPIGYQSKFEKLVGDTFHSSSQADSSASSSNPRNKSPDRKRTREKTYDLVTGDTTKKKRRASAPGSITPQSPRDEYIDLTSSPNQSPPKTGETRTITARTQENNTLITMSNVLKENNADPEDKGPSDMTVCIICREVPKEPQASKCGHICCTSCWDQWLQQRLECPKCRSRVRKKFLTRLYF